MSDGTLPVDKHSISPDEVVSPTGSPETNTPLTPRQIVTNTLLTLTSRNLGMGIPTYLTSPARRVFLDEGTAADLEGILFSEDSLSAMRERGLPSRDELIQQMRKVLTGRRSLITTDEAEKLINDDPRWPKALEGVTEDMVRVEERMKEFSTLYHMPPSRSDIGTLDFNQDLVSPLIQLVAAELHT